MSNHKNKSDQPNSNQGTTGTNKAHQKVLDNRSQQLNPKNPRYQGKK
jgi:hypothetical protein